MRYKYAGWNVLKLASSLFIKGLSNVSVLLTTAWYPEKGSQDRKMTIHKVWTIDCDVNLYVLHHTNFTLQYFHKFPTVSVMWICVYFITPILHYFHISYHYLRCVVHAWVCWAMDIVDHQAIRTYARTDLTSTKPWIQAQRHGLRTKKQL